jgi:hypothetical protein
MALARGQSECYSSTVLPATAAGSLTGGSICDTRELRYQPLEGEEHYKVVNMIVHAGGMTCMCWMLVCKQQLLM